MTILFLMSSLRSGSHMVRSMLRNDPLILDNRMEHTPIAEGEELPADRDVLVPLKYGHDAFTSDCLATNAYPNASALILHRQDTAQQALSLAHARTNGTWFGPTDKDEKVLVSAAEIKRLAKRNADDLSTLSKTLLLPHSVLAYEDITVASLKIVMDVLLHRDVVVYEPATVRGRVHE